MCMLIFFQAHCGMAQVAMEWATFHNMETLFQLPLAPSVFTRALSPTWNVRVIKYL